MFKLQFLSSSTKLEIIEAWREIFDFFKSQQRPKLVWFPDAASFGMSELPLYPPNSMSRALPEWDALLAGSLAIQLYPTQSLRPVITRTMTIHQLINAFRDAILQRRAPLPTKRLIRSYIHSLRIPYKARRRRTQKQPRCRTSPPHRRQSTLTLLKRCSRVAITSSTRSLSTPMARQPGKKRKPTTSPSQPTITAFAKKRAKWTYNHHAHCTLCALSHTPLIRCINCPASVHPSCLRPPRSVTDKSPWRCLACIHRCSQSSPSETTRLQFWQSHL